jgi:hypothetical protein
VIKSRRIRLVACRVLVEKTKGNIQLGRPWHRWKNTIRVDVKEIDYEGGGLDWVDLSQERDN